MSSPALEIPAEELGLIERTADMPPRPVPSLVTDEDGGAYTLSFVMAMPFLILFICVIVETTFMLAAKIGTVYASFAGARAAIVWDSLDSSGSAESIAQQAAVRAMIPFSSGGVASGSSADSQYSDYLKDYSQRIQAAGKTPAPPRLLRSKSAYASRAVTVSLQRTPRGPNSWDEDLSVDVTYAFPFAVPGVGRMFGTKTSDGYVYPMTSRTTLPNELPHNEERKLGIQYGR